MKLGIVADEIDRDFRVAVANGKKLNINRYEIRFLKSGRAPVCDESELRDVFEIANGEGVEITNLSPGLFKYTTDETGFRREMAEVFPRAVELAARWNLPHLTVFGFAKPGAKDEDGDLFSSANPPEAIYEWFAEACEKARAANLELLIEPEPISWADTMDSTVEIIKRVNHENLKINYDPSNIAWTTRSDDPEEIGENVDLIKNVHLKDQKHAALGSGFPAWTIIGTGEIDFRRRFEILQANDYDGVISLEPHFAFDLKSFAACRDAVLKIWNEVAEEIAASKSELMASGLL